MKRRGLFQIGILGSLGTFISGRAAGADRTVTPSEIEGPFYPVNEQADKDFDLTKINGHAEVAKGETITISGKVYDITGKAITGATIELWQANAAGKYRHPHDRSEAPIDENFQGWAVVPSGKKGGFRFKTIKPGAYSVGKAWTRPPHIHFKVTMPGYKTLTTQMYFPNQPLNPKDHLLQSKAKAEQALMIAAPVDSKKNELSYSLTLAKVEEGNAPQQE